MLLKACPAEVNSSRVLTFLVLGELVVTTGSSPTLSSLSEFDRRILGQLRSNNYNRLLNFNILVTFYSPLGREI